MRSHTVSSQDPIAVLGFLARLKMVCDHNGITEGAAVWCFQFYLSGQAHALLQSLLNRNTMAIDVERRELLQTYQQVINFLLRTFATDAVISEAFGDVTSFRQSSNMTEEVYSNHLWDKALRCGTVFSGRRVKSLFVERLLSATCAQVCNYLATHPMWIISPSLAMRKRSGKPIGLPVGKGRQLWRTESRPKQLEYLTAPQGRGPCCRLSQDPISQWPGDLVKKKSWP